MLGALASFARDTGTGVLVITHEREGLDAFDRVIELAAGVLSVHEPA